MRNLPETLEEWGDVGTSEEENAIWASFDALMVANGITLWKPGYWERLTRPGGGYPANGGFLYISPHLQFEIGQGAGRDAKYKTFPVRPKNALAPYTHLLRGLHIASVVTKTVSPLSFKLL